VHLGSFALDSIGAAADFIAYIVKAWRNFANSSCPALRCECPHGDARAVGDRLRIRARHGWTACVVERNEFDRPSVLKRTESAVAGRANKLGLRFGKPKTRGLNQSRDS
jgi:hypothetical protein